MNMRPRHILLPILCFAAGVLLTIGRLPRDEESEREDHAMEMFDWWYSQRALPAPFIPAGAWLRALETHKRLAKRAASTMSAPIPGQWSSIGPNNIGGRILALALDPTDRMTIWAGSASGGLWKSTSGGEGSSAWTKVNTGAPVVSVSAIAIDPADPDRIYIGTGELSFYQTGLVGTPGARSSYGLGILRSTDGGNSWQTTDLEWTFPQVTAVQKIVINPMNSATLFAATSEGVYKSTDTGAHWTVSDTNRMAMDLIMSPDDTTTLYASFGNLASTAAPGLYKTTDAGATWAQLTNGLPSSGFGRTALAVSPANPAVIYAGISNADPNNSSLLGLYVSTNRGGAWTAVNTTNYVFAQGWYDNVVAANPANADSVYCAGLDVYCSPNGGASLNNISDWTAGYLGVILPGGSEGAPTYVHADQHAILIDPQFRRTIYIGTDGGVFKSTDAGSTFYGINGGLVTTQFYNGLSNSATDSTIALGGLQDNGVIEYIGSPSWRKVAGGDGGWNAVDPGNNSILYGEYVYLAISKSTDGGSSFFSITNGLPGGSGEANFIAPFVLSPSSPNILYAGARDVYKTTNRGASWFAPNGGANLNGTKISAIGVSATSPDTLIAATGSSASQSPVFQLFVSTNGGYSWKEVSDSLPQRYPTDIRFDPTNSATAYVTFSGYGTPHLFRTTNLGQSWTNVTTGVDVPHQSVAIDPSDPVNIYAGTDLGVYYSSDAGSSWTPLGAGMDPAMILSLAVSPRNGTIRASTFGSGVYERPLVHIPRLALLGTGDGEILAAGQIVDIQWSQKYLAYVGLDYSLDSGATWIPIADSIAASAASFVWRVPDTVSTAGKLRVRDDGGTLSAVSDSVFSIVRNSDVTIGWNLLSLKVTPLLRSVQDLFPGATSPAFVYNSGYQPTDTLAGGSGFWLKFGSPAVFSYSGDTILTDTISVQRGWNMIGALSAPISTSSIQSIPDSILKLPAIAYFGGYFTADSLTPGHGYWINVGGAGLLILSHSPAQQRTHDQSDNRTVSSLLFTDRAGHRQTLYFGDTVNLHRNTEFPPLPPERSFDIRFTSQKFVELLSSHPQRYGISLTGVSFPLTLSRSGAPGFRGEINLIMPDGRSVAVRGGKTEIPGPAERVTIEYIPPGSASAPSSVSLERNYPNPFNPSTTIRFRIPADSRVKLVVSDITGREVATLEDGVRSAGEFEVTWNAAGYASGIYFYSLFTGAPAPGSPLTRAGTGKMALIR